jgi:hypothetical protein
MTEILHFGNTITKINILAPNSLCAAENCLHHSFAPPVLRDPFYLFSLNANVPAMAALQPFDLVITSTELLLRKPASGGWL